MSFPPPNFQDSPAPASAFSPCRWRSVPFPRISRLLSPARPASGCSFSYRRRVLTGFFLGLNFRLIGTLAAMGMNIDKALEDEDSLSLGSIADLQNQVVEKVSEELEKLELNEHGFKKANNYESSGETAVKNEKNLLNLPRDILLDILSGLSAPEFASVDMTCKELHAICDEILPYPKLLSEVAYSNQSLKEAIDQVFVKLLSRPIRPHFVMAFVDAYQRINMQQAISMIKKHVGKCVPVICVEVDSFVAYDVGKGALVPREFFAQFGLLVNIGYLPSMQVSIIPLIKDDNISDQELASNFVSKISNFSMMASDSYSPMAVLFFTDDISGCRPSIEMMDLEFNKYSAITGLEGNSFAFSGSILNRDKMDFSAVCLVIARNKLQTDGVDIHINLALSTSLVPVLQGEEDVHDEIKVPKINEEESDHIKELLSAKGNHPLYMPYDVFIENFEDNVNQNDFLTNAVYLGVLATRYLTRFTDQKLLFESFSFYGNGSMFNAGEDDKYGFYAPSRSEARKSIEKIRKTFSVWKESGTPHSHDSASSGKEIIVGCIIFSGFDRCIAGGDVSGKDIASFFKCFPTSVCGVYGSCEVARGYTTEEVFPFSSSIHFSSAAYLLISYTKR